MWIDPDSRLPTPNCDRNAPQEAAQGRLGQGDSLPSRVTAVCSTLSRLTQIVPPPLLFLGLTHGTAGWGACMRAGGRSVVRPVGRSVEEGRPPCGAACGAEHSTAPTVSRVLRVALWCVVFACSGVRRGSEHMDGRPARLRQLRRLCTPNGGAAIAQLGRPRTLRASRRRRPAVGLGVDLGLAPCAEHLCSVAGWRKACTARPEPQVATPAQRKQGKEARKEGRKPCAASIFSSATPRSEVSPAGQTRRL